MHLGLFTRFYGLENNRCSILSDMSDVVIQIVQNKAGHFLSLHFQYDVTGMQLSTVVDYPILLQLANATKLPVLRPTSHHKTE